MLHCNMLYTCFPFIFNTVWKDFMLEKGQSDNPSGPPKRTLRNEFLDSIRKVNHNMDIKSLLEHFIKRAYEDDAVLIEVMKKYYPT